MHLTLEKIEHMEKNVKTIYAQYHLQAYLTIFLQVHRIDSVIKVMTKCAIIKINYTMDYEHSVQNVKKP